METPKIGGAPSSAALGVLGDISRILEDVAWVIVDTVTLPQVGKI